jgi:hypothetical protein
MNWEWIGSENLADKSGTAKIVFTEQNISFDMPSFTIAHNLVGAIEREIAHAKRDGAMELAEAIRGTLYQITGDTR